MGNPKAPLECLKPWETGVLGFSEAFWWVGQGSDFRLTSLVALQMLGQHQEQHPVHFTSRGDWSHFGSVEGGTDPLQI